MLCPKWEKQRADRESKITQKMIKRSPVYLTRKNVSKSKLNNPTNSEIILIFRSDLYWFCFLALNRLFISSNELYKDFVWRFLPFCVCPLSILQNYIFSSHLPWYQVSITQLFHLSKWECRKCNFNIQLQFFVAQVLYILPTIFFIPWVLPVFLKKFCKTAWKSSQATFPNLLILVMETLHYTSSKKCCYIYKVLIFFVQSFGKLLHEAKLDVENRDKNAVEQFFEFCAEQLSTPAQLLILINGVTLPKNRPPKFLVGLYPHLAVPFKCVGELERLDSEW